MRPPVLTAAALFALATLLLPIDVFLSDDAVGRSPTLAASWREARRGSGPMPCEYLYGSLFDRPDGLPPVSSAYRDRPSCDPASGY